jgi:hypothetical protein
MNNPFFCVSLFIFFCSEEMFLKNLNAHGGFTPAALASTTQAAPNRNKPKNNMTLSFGK